MREKRFAEAVTPQPSRGQRFYVTVGTVFKLPSFLKLTTTDPFAAWRIVTEDATPGGIRVVRSVLGAISCLSIVVFREPLALTPEPWTLNPKPETLDAELKNRRPEP